ncbi:Allyl alcohol dehydrogenase-like protein [Rhynchospora pubera]|uniref:Allyl alcohol dehydrogenase-like protein n=1 Tax=Rhynchospora pubera TaxID=906938 RepID=A0AAV8FNG6_9POAL|nr:Allyl alcohol dehydrogenase-like protein [Rhynchospora pubera]
MGLLFWRKGKNGEPQAAQPSDKGADGASSGGTAGGKEVEGMHGAVEVRRPTEVTVFEFGSTKESGERVTLAGYCPVSDELEPCRWEIVPALEDDAPQFRIVF